MDLKIMKDKPNYFVIYTIIAMVSFPFLLLWVFFKGLGIVGNGFAECGWVGTTPEEPAFAVHEGDKVALFTSDIVTGKQIGRAHV